MKEFNIGDVVVVKEYFDVPEELRTKGMARLVGKKGTVVDKLYSAREECYLYSVQFDDFNTISRKSWNAEHLDLYVEKKTTYCLDMDVADGVVIGVLYEVSEDGSETEIARGHGHIIHEGVMGIAQALSYATKKIYEKLGGFINGR